MSITVQCKVHFDIDPSTSRRNGAVWRLHHA
jgi:hypothetical protein